MRGSKMSLPILLAFALAAVPASAQSQTGGIQVNFQTVRTGHLRVAGPAVAFGEAGATTISGGGTVVVVRVKAEPNGRAVLPLLARSNAAYHLTARLVNPPPEGLQVSVVSVSVGANSDGARVMPGATQAQMVAGPVGSSASTVILSGPRISLGGNNSTPNNALLIGVNLEFTSGLQEADVVLEMELL